MQQWQYVYGAWQNTILRPVLTVKLGANSLISTFFSRWYPLFLTKVSISMAHISVQKKNIASGSEPNRTLFRDNVHEFRRAKNVFQRYIICLCLKSFAKKSHFSKQTVKLTVKVCHILRAGPTGTQNQDLRPLFDSF